MTAIRKMPGGPLDWIGAERLTAWSGFLLVGFTVLLALLYYEGYWFEGPEGLKDADFLNVWAAGRLVLEGHPADVYDWAVHRRMEVAALGHDFTGYYGWHYPPMLLMAASVLGTMPYLVAWWCWSGVTVLFFAWALWRIVPVPAVVLPLLAAPATLWCVSIGQNGCLTAALMGGTLGFLHRRPVVAGIFLGLLTYKPHFGVLFPVALLAGRHWRAFAAATLTTLVFAGISAWLFGIETWQAFLHSTGLTMDDLLRTGSPGWSKIQSIYALVRQIASDERTAWAAQGAFTLALAALVAWASRSRMPAGVQAALLAIAAALASPYGYVYDLPPLAVAAAFLAREGLRDGFLPGEREGIALALVVPALIWPLGSARALAGGLLLIGLALRRGVAKA